MTATALTIAGSDPSGGAGIQADLKTFHRHGVYGMAVITALTAQNTTGVTGVHSVPPEFVIAQLDAVMKDIPPMAAKTGMLANAEIVSALADYLDEHPIPNLVVDPVMVATSGARLLKQEAERAYIERLIGHATLITPNIPEAAVLAGVESGVPEEIAPRILEMGCHAVLLKGGHAQGETCVDLLFTRDEERYFEHPRLDTRHTHGTGCTVSAAIAARLANGEELDEAVEAALDYVHRAIKKAPGLGSGHGPIDHFA